MNSQGGVIAVGHAMIILFSVFSDHPRTSEYEPVTTPPPPLVSVHGYNYTDNGFGGVLTAAALEDSTYVQ